MTVHHEKSELEEFSLSPYASEADLEEHPVSALAVEPHEIRDAGFDLRPTFVVREGARIRRRARRLFATACLNSINAREEARVQIREVLRVAASATYWLEDTNLIMNAHFDLHVMGRFAREEFSRDCRLHWTGSQYEQTCPVAIAHKRFGNSPEFIVRNKVCSLCGSDPADCPHVRDHLYRVRGGQADSPSGRCRVCANDKCDHDPAKTYLTNPTSIIIKIERLEALALVAKPRQPSARLTSLPAGTAKEMAEHFGPEFEPGMRLNCDRCLNPCPGFTYLSKLRR
jgi:hypothetical protein